MAKRIAIYARVSTLDQSVDNQLPDLRRFAKERGWIVHEEYLDEGVSGAKSSRPSLDRMMDAVRKRQVDVVLVWRFDRFARSVKHLVLSLEEFNGLGIDFVSYQENLDTSSPLGKALFAIIAAMAELERNCIVERVKAGVARARRRGKRLGRPRLSVDHDEILRLRDQGLSQRQIAKEMKISNTSVFRVLKSAAPKSA